MVSLRKFKVTGKFGGQKKPRGEAKNDVARKTAMDGASAQSIQLDEDDTEIWTERCFGGCGAGRGCICDGEPTSIWSRSNY